MVYNNGLHIVGLHIIGLLIKNERKLGCKLRQERERGEFYQATKRAVRACNVNS